jgi:hypothetical protein
MEPGRASVESVIFLVSIPWFSGYQKKISTCNLSITARGHAASQAYGNHPIRIEESVQLAAFLQKSVETFETKTGCRGGETS